MAAKAHINQWQSVLERDKHSDGTFVYAVRSTGIYCRPSCPSRRPNLDQVVFFDDATSAQENGFRPCLRCHPRRSGGDPARLDLIQRICKFIEQTSEIPSLADLARQFNLSPHHLQKIFKKTVGITPHQYADELRLKRFKHELKKGTAVTTALYQAGFASSSSVYERSVKRLGMTPVHYSLGAHQIAVYYSTVHCRLGWLLIARTVRGICALSLGDSADKLVAWLKEEFPKASLTQEDENLEEYIKTTLHYLNGKQPHCDLPLDLKATAFQRSVWEELRRIPYGTTRSYSQIAYAIGRPTASRAVARACASNPVSLVVPCHRVVRQGGDLGGYRWGIKRKKALLELERRRGSQSRSSRYEV